ncbi:hypothetical protein HDU97_001817 [Phlyctochytrium planicorne]|nr:hypothetical protein HDU97_001817 [Phlyctochytrium planicorne]
MGCIMLDPIPIDGLKDGVDDIGCMVWNEADDMDEPIGCKGWKEDVEERVAPMGCMGCMGWKDDVLPREVWVGRRGAEPIPKPV